MFELLLYIVYLCLFVFWVIAMWKLIYAFKHFKIENTTNTTELLDKLPSVTVCIPARNETHAMTECLEKVIASSYPKLEVIVMDDSSADDTSIIIKSFAHAGVRFIEGKDLPSGWLGKNYALQRLLEQASGSYIFFMDVDTRIQPGAIEQLVAYASQHKAQMVSVLPRREDGWRASVVFSSLRYLWELLFHSKSSPATASSAWLIERKVLLESDGFEKYKDAIQPESKYSGELMAKNKYRFLIGSSDLGVSYEKKWSSQLSTSIRLLYPLLGANPAAALITAFDLLLLVAPVIILISALFGDWTIHQNIALVLYALFAILYGLYVGKVWKRGWIIGSLIWPVVVLQESILILVSTLRYKTKTVTWKGRLVRRPRP